MRIFLIAGEPSGDNLGGKLMAALKARSSSPLEFYGVGGERMQEQGLTSLFPMKELSIMGFAEIIPHIPHLLKRIRQTADEAKRLKPDIVITIDAPEFCFRVAKKLQGSGIKLVHYVAPSVWAYREHRAAHIAKLYDHLLALLPFEPPYFEKEGLPCSFIGHSIVENGITKGDGEKFRKEHKIASDAPLLCLMPGSRKSELARLWPVFSETVIRLSQTIPSLVTVIPTIPALADILEPLTAALPARTLLVTTPAAKQDAFAASTVALAKSGTNTLELGIAGVPMVVAYKVKPFSAWLAKRLLKIKHVSLVNLIMQQEIIPEYLQENCTPELLEEAVLKLLRSEELRQAQQAGTEAALLQLGYGKTPLPSEKAAEVVFQVIS